MDGPADVVIFEDEAVFAGLREPSVVLLESLKRGGFVAELAAHVDDHYSVAVLLLGKLEEGEQLVVVFEVTDGGVDYFFARGAELGELEDVLGETRKGAMGMLTCPG